LSLVEIAIPRQIGLCVRNARKEQGLTQRELARRAGVSERLVLSLELGDAPGIRLDKLMSVTQALGIRLFAEPPLPGTDQPARKATSVRKLDVPDAVDTEEGASASNVDEAMVLGEPASMLERYRILYDELARATQERDMS
jgi:transcriptional regulator with XRE-family HTH domain